MVVLTPWFLWGAGLTVAANLPWKTQARPLLFWLVPIYLGTFLLEVAGVATGAVFGSYRYTPALGALVWGVPPVIGWNWVLVVLGTMFTYAPPGIGFWASAAPVFRQPWYWALGAIAVAGSLRYLYVLSQQPAKKNLPQGRRALW